MRKIGVTTKLATYMASVISGAMVFGSFAYLFTPAEVKPNPLPVVNFSNTNLDTGSITGTSPFALPDTSKMKVSDMPVPPGVPSMPVGAGMQADVLTVIGVLPPDVVILQKGGETLTARAGSATKWGTVNSISSSGATIDGAFIKIK